MGEFMKKVLSLLLIVFVTFTLSAMAQTGPWKTGVAITCPDGRTIPAGTTISGPNVTSADLCGSVSKNATPEDIAKVNQLENATGYAFRTTTDSSVTTYHVTKSTGDIKVVLAISSLGGKIPQLVVFCTVTPSATLPNNAVFYRALLHYSLQYDMVKVGLDSDSDLSVRIDIPLETLDAQTLKVVIDQVANVSNDVLTDIKSQLVK